MGVNAVAKSTASHVQSCLLCMHHCRSRPTAYASLQEQARVEVERSTVEVGRPRVEDVKVQLMSLLGHHTFMTTKWPECCRNRLDIQITVVAPDEALASDMILPPSDGNTLHNPSHNQLSSFKHGPNSDCYNKAELYILVVVPSGY